MEIRGLQSAGDIRISIPLIKKDGSQATGVTLNTLSTVIRTPSGNTLIAGVDYTEATFAEIGGRGVYECLFPANAETRAFTLADQKNPYTIILDSSEADVEPTPIAIWISSVLPGDVAKEASLTPVLNTIAALQTDIGDPSASATTIDARIQALQAAVGAIPVVNVLSGATVSGNTYLRKGGTWTCKRGDFGFNIPFDLGMDITGYTLKWGMKKSFEETAYIVNPTTIAPEQISNWLLGLGTIPITSASQTEQTPYTYHIEIEITKGTSATLSPWDGKLKIEYDIIRPAA